MSATCSWTAGAARQGRSGQDAKSSKEEFLAGNGRGGPARSRAGLAAREEGEKRAL